MEWLLAHEDDPDLDAAAQSFLQDAAQSVDAPVPMDESQESPTDKTQTTSSRSESSTMIEAEQKSEDATSSENSEAKSANPKSIKCDECGKLFSHDTEVEYHAVKSGHSKFSESTEEKKPLTEEEKKEMLAKIEVKLKQRRQEREAREKQEELEREKNRIKSGKEMLEAKQKYEDMELKKIVEQRKREKEEERQARQRVKEQIEQDKLARKAKFGSDSTSSASMATAASNTVAKALAPTKNYNEVRLQIKLTNGTALTQTFGAKEPLSAVRVYVEMNRTDGVGPFALMTSFPKKIFGPEDYEKPLDLLGAYFTVLRFPFQRISFPVF